MCHEPSDNDQATRWRRPPPRCGQDEERRRQGCQDRGLHPPCRGLFPLLGWDSAEFKELVEDIKAQGLLEPITMYQGRLLDGRNRLLACFVAKVEPRFEEYKGDDPFAHVLSRNWYRRHLTVEQRAEVLHKLRAQGMSIRAIAETAKVPKSTVARDLKRTTSQVSHSGTTDERVTGKDGKSYSAKKTTTTRRKPATTGKKMPDSKVENARAEQAMLAVDNLDRWQKGLHSVVELLTTHHREAVDAARQLPPDHILRVELRERLEAIVVLITTDYCTWCGSAGPLRPVEDLFGGTYLVCDPRCAMSLERACDYVDQVAELILARSPEPGAVRHALIGAVLHGARFATEGDVWRWLEQHTGLPALEVSRR